MHPTLLGLDVGTTAAKAVLFDLQGNELALAERAYPLITLQPGWAELEPQVVWQAAQDVISEITSQQPQGSHISAVGLSTQGGTLIPADGDGNPVYNAITWLDQRAAPIISEWQAQGLHRWIRQRSGWSPQPGLPLTSLSALRIQQPDIFSSIETVFSVNDFLAYQLTDVRCTNPSMAGEMLLVNLKSGGYDPELCEQAGIRPGMLSPIQPSDTICEQIKPDLSQKLGLPPATPLINGGQDHACEALTLGMTEPGATLLACGTAWVINTITDTPEVASFPPEIALNAHVIPNRWIASQYLGGFGAGFTWWLDQFWKEKTPGKDRFTDFDAALAYPHKKEADIFYFPVSGTPRSGLSVGGFWGLRLDHTPEDFGRAVLESAAFELGLVLETLDQLGMHSNELWMVGGAAHSSIWPQILADANQTSILLTQYHHGPALGAAILAGSALGLLGDTSKWVSSTHIQPAPQKAVKFRQKRDAYLSLLAKLST